MYNNNIYYKFKHKLYVYLKKMSRSPRMLMPVQCYWTNNQTSYTPLVYVGDENEFFDDGGVFHLQNRHYVIFDNAAARLDPKTFSVRIEHSDHWANGGGLGFIAASRWLVSLNHVTLELQLGGYWLQFRVYQIMSRQIRASWVNWFDFLKFN